MYENAFRTWKTPLAWFFCASRSYPTHFFFALCTNLLIHLVLDYAKKPLTSDEAVKIQNLLKAALKELTDDHVLLVLKRSLLLYFKVCLYPYPAPHLVKLSGREGKWFVLGKNSTSEKGPSTTTSKLNGFVYPAVNPKRPYPSSTTMQTVYRTLVLSCISPHISPVGVLSHWTFSFSFTQGPWRTKILHQLKRTRILSEKFFLKALTPSIQKKHWIS